MPLPPGVSAQFTALYAGPFGNLIYVSTADDPGGADITITVTDTTRVLLTIGTTGGNQNVDWDVIAAAFNADPMASLLAFAEGDTSGAGAPYVFFGGALSGGSYGLGAGQFYFGATPPEPLELSVALVFCGVIRYLVKDTPEAAR